MTSALPKRLIEVDLPIKRISAHASREKSIRHGHISTLHIWWARRPLAACRAVLCAALWPDPADPHCPEAFRKVARESMLLWSGDNLKLLGAESAERFVAIRNDPAKIIDNEELRGALLDFIADFSNWDNSTSTEYLATSQTLTQAAHEALGGVPGTRPLVVDPFAGGGSIPLEALRVGADAFASDLNPIPVLLNKLMLEYVPRYGERLADEVRRWGGWIGTELTKKLSGFFPESAKHVSPAVYFWARTAKCEGPGCGIVIPMLRSAYLVEKKGRSVWLEAELNPVGAELAFTLREGKTASNALRVVRRGSLTCPVCNYTTPAANVRKQFQGRAGGIRDARLLAIGEIGAEFSGKRYRLPTKADFEAAEAATQELDRLKSSSSETLSLIPDEELPYLRSIFNIQLLDVHKWGDLFSPRQALVLSTLAGIVRQLGKQIEGEAEFRKAVVTCLALAVGRCADSYSTLCWWISGAEKPVGTFGRQALPIVWDYCEVNPLVNSPRSWSEQYQWVLRFIEHSTSIQNSGTSELASAMHLPLPDDSAHCIFTDPPYYDAVPYADLSDFFYVWLRRMLKDFYPTLFAETKTPKKGEVVQLAERNPIYSYKTREYFESSMQSSLSEARRVLMANGLGVVVFAHKSTASWEVQLKAMLGAGWIITGSWPIDTERPGRLRAQNSATLASSIHLVCRPRPKTDGKSTIEEVGDWRDVLSELPRRIHDWMPRLAEERVVGADAIFACLGPALEIFSRYSSVEKANGQTVTLREYLEHVWAAVSKEALAMVFKGADASGFEEDARLTAMWLWTLSAGQSGNGESDDDESSEEEESDAVNVAPSGYVLEYDAARKIAQGLGAHLEALTSLVEVKGEVARLLPVAERTRRLFGKDEAESPTTKRKKRTSQLQLGFVAELEQAEEAGSWGSKGAPTHGATFLDRVHQCMILFAAGRGEALRRFLVDEGVGKDERFWRLAQVLSYLYPPASDERRWVDGVLARKKGLGF
jgi:putative DNA methylase